MNQSFVSKNDTYEVLEKHAEGGFGVAYRVRSQKTGAELLLKKLHLSQAEDWKAVEMFEREANVLRGLSHPNIPKFVDSFHEGAELFIVQEFIQGRTLQDYINKKTPLSQEEFLAYLKQCAEVLVYLHGLVPPLIHRDVTPKNLIVSTSPSPSGSVGEVHLVDFGSVKTALQSQQVSLTGVGTFGFMAPEQTMGQPQPASDLYGLGMTFVSLAAQAAPEELPLDPKTGRADIRKAVKLPGWVLDLLEEMTRPGAAERLGDARELVRRLVAGPPKPRPREPKPHEPRAAAKPMSPMALLRSPVFGVWQVISAIATVMLVIYFYGRSKEPVREETLHEKHMRQCNEGDAWVCAQMGNKYRSGEGVEKNSLKAFELLTRACNGKNDIGCNNLGTMYEAGDGIEKSLARARELYEKACSLGSPFGCANAGVMYEAGSGGPIDLVRAAQLQTKACDMKNSGGCNNLGLLYERGAGVTQDYAKAAEYYIQACQMEDPYACSNMGLLYRDGKGVERDYVKAHQYFESACARSNLTACNSMAILYEEGKGVTQDYAKALSIYEQACSKGAAYACTNAGFLYMSGKGVEADTARALKIYEKSCIDGSMLGCNNLGYAYQEGTGVAKDLVRARGLYQKACDGGTMLGCTNAGWLYENDVKDPVKAAAYYKRACDGGNSRGCEYIKAKGAPVSTPTPPTD
jgi:TPR repeat protein